MSHHDVRSAFVLVLLTVSVIGLDAAAQDQAVEPEELAPGEEVEEDAEVSKPSAGTVEEIVVTITKRRQAVQDIAGAVTGFSGTQIQTANIQNTGDLVSLIPNATIKSQGGPITIRGVSQSFSSQSPVAAHVNGVFVFDGALLGAMFYDLQGIEVARGPSGTVYGRNATAGALNYVWQTPKEEFDVFGDITVGNYERLDFRGGMNIPLLGNGDDRLMSRFVFQVLEHDAYVDNLETEGRSRDESAVDTWHVRGAIEANPFDDVKVELRGFHTENKCCVAESRAWQPFPDVGALAIGGVVIPTNPYGSAKPLSPNVRETRSRAFELDELGGTWSGFDGQFSWNLVSTPEWLGDVELALLGGIQFGDNNDISDADGSELSILDTLRDDRRRNGTVEARAVSSGGEWVNWIAGLFYFNHKLERFQQTRTTVGLLPSFSPLDIEALLEATNQGIAPYFNVTVRPPKADWLEVFGGFRWNQDKVEVKAENLPVVPVPVRPPASLRGSRSFGEPTGEFGVRADWGDGNQVYTKYSRGYKAGNIELTVEDGTNSVEPELIDAVEIGSKNRFLDNRLILNLTGFWYGYQNLQVPTIQGLEVLTKNAAEARIWGVEFETTIVPIDDWNIIATASYLNAKFDEFCTNDAAQFLTTDECPRNPALGPPNGIDGTLDLSGNRLEDSPEWKFTLLTNYNWDLGRGGVITPVLKFTWSDGYFLRPFNCGSCFSADGIDEQESFSRTDIRLQWRSPANRLWAEGFIENIEDNGIYSLVVVGSQFNGGLPARFGFQTPRIYGFRVGFNWEGI